MQEITIDAFTHFKYLSALRYAPDGKHAAFVVSTCEEDLRTYRGEIWLYNVESGELFPLTAAGKEKSFCWEDADHLLFPAARSDADTKAAAKGPHTAFYRISIHGGEARPAFSVPLRGASVQPCAFGFLVRANYDPMDNLATDTENAPPKSDVQILDELPFWFNGQGFVNKKRSRLYRYQPDTDTLLPLTPPLGHVGSAVLSPDNRSVAYAMTVYDSVHPQKNALWTTDLATGDSRELLAGDTYQIDHIAFLDEDTLVLSMTDNTRYGTSENDQLYRFSLSEGALSVLTMPDTDIGGNIGTDVRLGGGQTFKTNDGLLYVTLGIDNDVYLCTIDREGTMQRIAGGDGSIDCFDVHDGRILYIGMRGMELQELHRFEDGNASPVSELNKASLADYALAATHPLSFTNADGIRIDGWVLTPPDFDPAKRYPAVLNIHGGPKAAFGAIFHHEMQYWAAQGYIVCYCNPRGSAGRGDAFADLRGKYGTIDYDDLMAFLDKVLAAYPSIDEGRVCVAGGSYGGFMVNWIIGHTDRFAAAASQRSIANWTSKCLTTDIGYYHNLSQIAGDPWQTPELFWEKSPLKYAPQVKTPTLFIHSNEDYRCWMAEGLQMFTALKMHGVKTRLCLFEGENHELSRSGKPVNRIRRLKEITEWFDMHTTPGEA